MAGLKPQQQSGRGPACEGGVAAPSSGWQWEVQGHSSVINKVERIDDLFDVADPEDVDERSDWVDYPGFEVHAQVAYVKPHEPEKRSGLDLPRMLAQMLARPRACPQSAPGAVPVTPGLQTRAQPAHAQAAAAPHVAPASCPGGAASKGQGQTTLVLQGLPYCYSRDMVVEMMEAAGYTGHFDFVYMPSNFTTGTSFGYAFVNMVTPSKAMECWHSFHGFTGWCVPSDRICEVSWATIHGLEANIERYRNSPVMHPAIHEALKPIILGRDGKRRTFPRPTRAIKPPKLRPQK